MYKTVMRHSWPDVYRGLLDSFPRPTLARISRAEHQRARSVLHGSVMVFCTLVVLFNTTPLLGESTPNSC